eukprot:15195645-Ditylum_brightwellii.AAC.1
MAQELIKWVAPTSSAYQNVVKFVPAPLVTDQTIKNSKSHYADLLKEQNYYSKQYTYFCIGRLSAETFNAKVGKQTVKDMLIDGEIIINIKPTVFSDTKGMWIMEPTQDRVADAIEQAKRVLLEITTKIGVDHFGKFEHFCHPRVLVNFNKTTNHVKNTVKHVNKEVITPSTRHNLPPKNVWNNGAPNVYSQPAQLNATTVQYAQRYHTQLYEY